MESGTPPNLEALAQLGRSSGVDMRPTLLRVLTDLYVQKLSHTPDEERHYTELALRLLDTVDVATRGTVAARLAHHLAPPPQVIRRLARDLPGVAEAVRNHPLLQAGIQTPVEIEAPKTIVAQTGLVKPEPAKADLAEVPVEAVPLVVAVEHDTRDLEDRGPDKADETVHAAEPHPPADLDAPIGVGLANELNELFFAANAEERRLILLNLEVATPLPPGRVSLPRDSAIVQRLERAALAQNREEFAQHLAQALQIPRLQAKRIASDELGEPVVIAAKALAMPRDVLYRVLLFVNTAVGHSVERVHTLATLYDEMTVPAAEHMTAIWQVLQKTERHDQIGTEQNNEERSQRERKPARHQPLLWNDEARARARSASATVRRAPSTQRPGIRRDAS